MMGEKHIFLVNSSVIQTCDKFCFCLPRFIDVYFSLFYYVGLLVS